MQKVNNNTSMQVAPRDHFLDNASMSGSDGDEEAVEDGMLFDAQPALTSTPTPTPLDPLLDPAPTPTLLTPTADSLTPASETALDAVTIVGQGICIASAPDLAAEADVATEMDVDATGAPEPEADPGLRNGVTSAPEADPELCDGVTLAPQSSAGAAADSLMNRQARAHSMCCQTACSPMPCCTSFCIVWAFDPMLCCPLILKPESQVWAYKSH